MKIPIVADFNKSVATKYGVLVPNDGVPFRALFIISPEGILRQITVNDLPVGRNVDETIRLVKAFQFTDKYGEVCPANWLVFQKDFLSLRLICLFYLYRQPGDKTMAADPEKSKDYFRAVNPAPGIPAASAPLEEVEDPAKLASIIASPTLTVVDFWAPWCRNCSKILPAVTRLAGTYTGAKFVKVNTVAAEAIAIEKGADVLPTFQFYKNGTKIGQFTGSDIAGLEAAIASYL
jgi:thiol-disulfide isomerase/thioredoxin